MATPDGTKAALQIRSTTGRETGRRETSSGESFWLLTSDEQPETTNLPTVVKT